MTVREEIKKLVGEEVLKANSGPIEVYPIKRFRTGTFSWPLEGKFPVPYY
jgi:hypothetical protein